MLWKMELKQKKSLLHIIFYVCVHHCMTPTINLLPFILHYQKWCHHFAKEIKQVSRSPHPRSLPTDTALFVWLLSDLLELWGLSNRGCFAWLHWLLFIDYTQTHLNESSVFSHYSEWQLPTRLLGGLSVENDKRLLCSTIKIPSVLLN